MPLRYWDLITQAIKDGTCVPFLGAGASTGYKFGGADVPGVPLARGFVKEFNNASGLNGTGPGDFIAAAEELVYRSGGSRDKLERIVRDEIAKVWQPRPIHTALAQLPNIRHMITTNYDQFIERALGIQHRSVIMHCHDKNNPNTAKFRSRPTPGGNDVLLHKMHGTVENPSTLIATRSDYIRYLADLNHPERGMPDYFLKEVLPHNTLLFLGYSLSDWNFLVIWEGVLASYHAVGTAIKSYAVMHDCSEMEEDYLRDRQVKVIKADLCEVASELAKSFDLSIPDLGIQSSREKGGAA